MNDTPARPKDFLREIVDEHCRQGTYGGRVVTRFPPEPNGYLHIGHAKSICLNFGLARQYGGACNLRMDDTNPTTEDPEYVASIQADVRWLGFDWTGFFHASDYFEQLYAFAEQLIRAGKAYVCSLSEADMRAYRGTVNEPGRASPYRGRTVDENLDLFRRMRKGEFPDGAHTLRAKIDMSDANMKMRDPPLYRIRRAHHYRTGDAWTIYPLYDFAHCLSDQIEGITHSICTLEFENNRELYDWILDALVAEPRPHQYEFARLVITYTVLSKRKLLELVEGRLVSGWDDPRMPTLSGLRRRGYTPEAIRTFCETIGVSKTNSVVEVALLESCVRDDLNRRAPRVLAVLDPLKVTLTNVTDGEVEMLDAPYFPADVPEGTGSRAVPFSRTLFIEREDFAETPPKGWHRLAPGGEVRLRHAAVIRCDEVIKNDAGEVVELRCTVDRSSDRKPKGTIHWVSAAHALDVEVRLYDRLFSVENPDRSDTDYKTFLNPQSLVTRRARIEPSVASAAHGAMFQFERHGFFTVDPDSKSGALVFNRTVALKDSWGKQQRAETAPQKTQPKPAPKAEAPKVERELSPEAAALRDRYALSPDDAHLIADAGLIALFESAVASGANGKTVGTLVANDLHRVLKAENRAIATLPFGGRELADLSALVDDGTLTAKLAREVVAEMVRSGAAPGKIVADRGYRQVSDEGALGAAIDGVLAARAELVARYRSGETKLYGVLIGELMKATEGKANAKLAGELLRRKLGG